MFLWRPFQMGAAYFPLHRGKSNQRVILFVCYCRVINYHKSGSLKQCILSISQCMWVRGLNTALLLRVPQGHSQVIGHAAFTREPGPGRICFQAHLGRWQNSLSCNRRTEGPRFLLAVGWRLPSAPRGHPWFIAPWAFPTWLLTSSSHQGESLGHVFLPGRVLQNIT